MAFELLTGKPTFCMLESRENVCALCLMGFALSLIGWYHSFSELSNSSTLAHSREAQATGMFCATEVYEFSII
jgi:hypothetical protein